MVTSSQDQKLEHFASNIDHLEARKKLDANQKAQMLESFDKSVLTSINTKLLALKTIDK